MDDAFDDTETPTYLALSQLGVGSPQLPHEPLRATLLWVVTLSIMTLVSTS